MEDPNPLIRALAIRTMGYIHVDKVTACLIQPLRHCMRDQDPYVRKTAAVCVAKLFLQDRHLVENAGFIDLLRDMLVDSNPSVCPSLIESIWQEEQGLTAFNPRTTTLGGGECSGGIDRDL